jgi:acetyltransferase-like isoleucine patch superfamily enzyme
MSLDDIIVSTDKMREKFNFLSIADTCALASSGNVILDPWSALISRNATIGTGNVFYPNVTIECDSEGHCNIGTANKFYPGTLISICQGGKVDILDDNEFGDGGFVIKANRVGSHVRVGSNGRYISGVQIMGQSTLGNGSQIIGPITVQDCTLDGGESYRGTDPDLRGAVLKGSGLARKLTVPCGQVINASGSFSANMIEPQSNYH